MIDYTSGRSIITLIKHLHFLVNYTQLEVWWVPPAFAGQKMHLDGVEYIYVDYIYS